MENERKLTFVAERYSRLRQDCIMVSEHCVPKSDDEFLTLGSSSIIQETMLYCTMRDAHHLAYFYFSFSDKETQRTDTFLRSILRQLLLQRGTVPDEMINVYKMYKHTHPPTEIWTEGIKSVIRTSGQTFVIIDALDECPSNSGERARLLEAIKSIHGYNLSSLHVLVTSRRESDIDRILRPILETPPLSIQNAEVDSDIRVYIAAEMAKDENMSKWSSMLQEEVREELGSKAKGMNVPRCHCMTWSTSLTICTGFDGPAAKSSRFVRAFGRALFEKLSSCCRQLWMKRTTASF